MRVEIWSDIACPWCYIGKRRFDVALSRFEHRDAVEVRYRSFELDPSAAKYRELAYLDHLMAKYGISVAEADAMIDTMIEAGARNGVVLRFDKAKPGNTFDAHRLLHLGAARGVQAELKERLFRATFTKGAAIADHDVLVAAAVDAGLDAAEAGEMLAGEAYAGDVRADEQRAADLGITSVPFFVMAGLGVSGAQPPDILLEVLQDAWAETVAYRS
ncbi:MAG TPA: DsbA family oxidoreductase [Acidimicrobiales bacterium]|nr:DsbA family oxidoreductase [Acidimicrobiales bacterium]